MLRLSGGQVESLFDEVLPSGVRQLPGYLAVLDGLLGDRALLDPVQRCVGRIGSRSRAPVGADRPVRAVDDRQAPQRVGL
jgi:hypothetical protein